MHYKITIPGRLPNLNDYTKACRGRRGNIMGALMKNEWQQYIERHIPLSLKHRPIKNKVRLIYSWYEPDARRDIDNISGFGHKIIQDALVAAGVLEDDDQKHVIGYADDFYVDKDKPRIELIIEEIGEQQWQNAECLRKRS